MSSGNELCKALRRDYLLAVVRTAVVLCSLIRMVYFCREDPPSEASRPRRGSSDGRVQGDAPGS